MKGYLREPRAAGRSTQRCANISDCECRFLEVREDTQVIEDVLLCNRLVKGWELREHFFFGKRAGHGFSPAFYQHNLFSPSMSETRLDSPLHLLRDLIPG